MAIYSVIVSGLIHESFEIVTFHMRRGMRRPMAKGLASVCRTKCGSAQRDRST